MTPVTPDPEHPGVTRIRPAHADPHTSASSTPELVEPTDPIITHTAATRLMVWSAALLWCVACWAGIAWLVREVIL